MTASLFALPPLLAASSATPEGPRVDHGPTVVDGFVRRTSVSALTSFDPQSYAGCPRRWWWQRVAGKKEAETTAQGVGKAGHSQNEEYLKTGVDVLGPIARAGKHLMPAPGADLIVEANFGDLKKALFLRDTLRQGGTLGQDTLEEVKRAAGLTAGGIPLDGYIDLRHSRGEWVDNTGCVLPEESSLGRVAEVVDHKFTSSIADYSKSPGELAETIQMVGYANLVFNLDPAADHTRVSHIYYQTRGPKLAKKVTAILSRRAAEDKWRRVDGLAIYMQEVAKATRVEDVEAQTKSCTAYKGCPHRAYCPVKLSFGNKTTTQGENGMSLFGNVMQQQNTNGTAPTTNGTTTAPVGNLFGGMTKPQTPAPAQERAAIDATKARLAAEDAGVTATVAYGFCQSCGAKLDSANASKLTDGSVKHIGCASNGVITAAPSTTVAPHQITPPDVAKPTLAQTAAPLPASALAEVTDPEIRQRAEAVQQAHTETAVAVDKKGGRCTSGGQVHQLSQKEIVTRKTKCPGCGKGLSIKDDHFTEDFKGMTIPGHNLPKVEVPPASIRPVTPAPAAQPVQEQPQPTPIMTVVQDTGPEGWLADRQRSAPAAVLTTGITIFVDAMKDRGPRPTPLEDYWRPMVAELEKQAGGCDLRCAPNDTPVGYGKWRGLLATWVREKPPAAGVYFARGGNDFDAVVVDALSSVADITRGVR